MIKFDVESSDRDIGFFEQFVAFDDVDHAPFLFNEAIFFKIGEGANHGFGGCLCRFSLRRLF